jgi:hypothetical protein
MIRFIRKAKKRFFFDGPALFNYPGRRMSGYRSPNVLIGQWLHAFTVKHFTVSGRMLILITGPFFVAGLTTLRRRCTSCRSHWPLSSSSISFSAGCCARVWPRPSLEYSRSACLPR